MAQVVDSVQAAREAASRLAWREAYDSYSTGDPKSFAPHDLETFAEAAWWTGKLDEAINLRERAYAGHVAAGDRPTAARLALTLSWDYSGRGAFAVSQGWFANAERLLEGQPESAEHGVVALTRGVNALFGGGSLSQAIEDFGLAHELGGRFGDRDTQALALVGKGRALVKSGEAEQGLALIDEASAAAVCGDLRPHSTGLVYCITISCCQELGDYRRAAEWTEAANRWCDRLDVSGFPGACRIHRAEMMRLRGDLLGAEKQAVAACEELHDFERSITAGGYYEIGEIRRRLGDFAAADEAYRTANELGRDPQPGLALLRLAEGKIDTAVAGINRALAETRGSTVAPAASPRADRDRDCGSRLEDGPRGGGGGRGDRRRVHDRGPPRPGIRCDDPRRFRPNPGRRGRHRRSNPLPTARARRMAGGRRAVRDSAREDAARNRLPAAG